MSDVDRFDKECIDNARLMVQDDHIRRSSLDWICDTAKYKYTYNFRWLGLPLIQFPQDLMAIQEIVWRIRPDLIIETGVARGGSLIFYASLLELMGGDRTVVGVDVEIRPHNRSAIAGHPLSHRIQLIEGSSIDPEIISKVGDLASLRSCVLVVLDSNHTHEHVLAELRAYSRFVTHGSYVVVLDTIVEDMPKEFFPDRPWGPGNNPRTAARMFLAENPAFRVDADIENKLLITVAPGGYLQRVR